MIIWSLSGEQENLAAAGHVELIWRTEESYCCWPCGAHLKLLAYSASHAHSRCERISLTGA